MHSTGEGTPHGERCCRLSCVRRRLPWVLLSVLLPVGLQPAQRWKRHEQRGRVQQKRAAELVAKQLDRRLYACRGAVAHPCSPHGR